MLLSKIRCALILTALVLPCLKSEAGLKIYYVRHGETGANVRKQWENKPKEEWPEYVRRGVLSFTPKGDQQVAALVAKL